MVETIRPEGCFILSIFAALAEFERELISEHTKSGVQSARRHGVHSKQETRAGASALLNVDVQTLRRALQGRHSANTSRKALGAA